MIPDGLRRAAKVETPDGLRRAAKVEDTGRLVLVLVLVLVLANMLENMQILETCRVLIGVEDKH